MAIGPLVYAGVDTSGRWPLSLGPSLSVSSRIVLIDHIELRCPHVWRAVDKKAHFEGRVGTSGGI